MPENKYDESFFENFEKMYAGGRNARVYKSNQNEVKRSAPKKRARRRVSPVGLLIILVAVALCVVLIVLSVFKIGSFNNNNNNEAKPASVELVSSIPQGFLNDGDEIPKLEGNINSEYAVLVNVTDNLIIAGNNAEQRVSPASLTKILTLLVAVENIPDLDDTFTMTNDITDPLFSEGASVAGFSVGEEVPLKDFLYGAILPSGADSTMALAHYVAGSEQAFAKMMTERVKEMGITTANFTNSSGLYGDEHYCTVKDMAIILKEAMENETCREVLSAYKYTTTKTEHHPDGITLTSTLFSRMHGNECVGATITAGKTGYITEAGNCIASFAVGDDGKEYIFVSVKADDKWNAVYDHINAYSRYVGNSDKEYQP